MEKTAFITDKGKWIFHSLLLGINIGPSAFLYALWKVLAQCSEYTLNYLNDIMVFSEMWKSHLNHLKEVFQWLHDVNVKIKCSKSEFFKSKVHILGYHVGTDGIWPLKVATIQALEPPRNIEELWHFLGLVGFFRKFILFFADVTACFNTMLRKGTVFKWTEQCNNAFNLI